MNNLIDRYLNYNVEDDPSGSIGISIASDISKRCDYDLERVRQLVKNYDSKREEFNLPLKRLGKVILEKSLSKPIK